MAEIRKAPPKVTVGLPVFNGGEHLREVLHSLLHQTYSQYDILISDNCSTDCTARICAEFAAVDTRIRYVKQSENIGAAANFLYVLFESCTPYFMWNAADDVRSSDFLEHNVFFLETHPDYVASTSASRFQNGAFDPIRMGDASLSGTPEENFIAFFRSWHANARFYSVFRRDVLIRCESLGMTAAGLDWVLILECCKIGKFNRSNQGYVILGEHGVSRSSRALSIFRRHWYEMIAPLGSMSCYTMRLASPFSSQAKLRLITILFKLNALALWAQIKLTLRRISRRDV